MRKIKPAPVDYVAETSALFERAVLYTLAENAGQIQVHRCKQAIHGVEGQDTCDLPVDGKVLTSQMAALADGDYRYHFFCCVHHQAAAFKKGGVDVARVYDGSPYREVLATPASPLKNAA